MRKNSNFVNQALFLEEMFGIFERTTNRIAHLLPFLIS